ncbi:MAG: hypothetical protein B7Z73_06445, partial [Planctomycetia bacterium 21-64-5]
MNRDFSSFYAVKDQECRCYAEPATVIVAAPFANEINVEHKFACPIVVLRLTGVEGQTPNMAIVPANAVEIPFKKRLQAELRTGHGLAPTLFPLSHSHELL